MSTLLLLQGYNNYFNRVVKFYNTVAEYKQYTYHEVEANFNPNDGVDAEHIFNSTNISPDYLVVYEDNVIKSRWFVLEWVRTRVGQYKASLKRDVKADLYNVYIDAPAYIERAMVNLSNPMLFNNEGGSYNLIKTSETLLGNEGRWIVGYVSKGTEESFPTLSGEVELQGEYTLIDTAMADWEFNQPSFVGLPKQTAYTTYIAGYWATPGHSGTNSAGVFINDSRYSRLVEGKKNKGAIYRWYSPDSLSEVFLAVFEKYTTSKIADLKGTLVTQLGSLTAAKEAELWSYNNKRVKDLANKIYDVSIVRTSILNNMTALKSTDALFTPMSDIVHSISKFTDTSQEAYAYTENHYEYAVTITPVSNIEFSSGVGRYRCADTPLYDMFAIPYDSLQVYGRLTEKTSPRVSVELASSIAKNATESGCFDLQLLPYCPIRDYILDSGIVILPSDDANKGWQLIEDENNKLLTIIIYPTKSNSSFLIEKVFNAATTPIEAKINNECDLYRLCSPNGQGAFEFSLEKNGGVEYWNVDITYKPYNPYIHIAPQFNNLYGADFDDFRGLTCSGDFSFGTLNDAWANYELNNKNYQSIFNREIENMDFNHKYQMMESGLNAVTGALGSGVSTGIKTGSVAAGITAGGLSLAGGVADLFINEKKYNETVDFKKDMFDFLLGNIKALPNTISKTSAFVTNNKKLPYIEYYTATDVEKAALRNNITYSSMKVGVTSSINFFLNGEEQFVKAVLIKLPDLKEDTHMAQELYGELAKGAYFK